MEAYGGSTRVYTNLIAIVGACHIGYIGDMRGPGTVIIAADTILWYVQFDRCTGFLQRAHQDELGTSIPHAAAGTGDRINGALHAINHLSEDRVAHGSPALLGLLHAMRGTRTRHEAITGLEDIISAAKHAARFAKGLKDRSVEFGSMIAIKGEVGQ